MSIATGLNGVCLLFTKYYPTTKRYQRVDNRTRHTKLKRLIMMQQQISSENLMDIIASKKIMQQKGLMYNSAVDAGLKPMAYSFLGLPLKKIQVRLDFKVWNKVGALSLYFTELTKNKAYSITVYKDQQKNIYCDRDGKVDFSAPNINGTVYELYVYQSKSGVYSLNTARVITDNSYLSTK